MTATAAGSPVVAAAQWELWTTTMRIVVANPDLLAQATDLLHRWLADVELAASRFRPDSQVCQIARSDATDHRVSPLLGDMIAAALTAARVSGGRVDPSVGSVISRLETPMTGPTGLPTPVSTARQTTWRDIDLDGSMLRMPPGTLLDLGATGKAFAADHAAESIASALGCGVLVSLGGDIRAGGPDPEQGWSVLVQDGDDQPGCVVDLGAARALATSSTLHRRLGVDRVQHMIDPLTLRPIDTVWRTVTVAADTCVRANTWSTAAMVAGGGAPGLLAGTGFAARLVGADGSVIRLGGWPA